MHWKHVLKKVWYFIWESDSWASWLVNILLAFIIIKFMIYPALGFTLQTSHPIVAVVSGSMEHDGSFDDWWVSKANCGLTPCTQEVVYFKKNITKEQFEDFPLHNGFNTGDIMILYGTKPEKIKIGDVIVFQANRPDPIIHRVIAKKKIGEKYRFTTKGDHNTAIMPFETEFTEDRLIGRAIIPVPFLGHIKIWFVKLLHVMKIA